MTISIISVHYKTPALLSACLASLGRATKGMRAEVIVVDNSPGYLIRRSLGKVKLLTNPRNAGYSAAANQGIEVARGQFLFFLNPDTVLAPNALQELLRAGRSIAALGCAGPRISTPRGIATSAFPPLRPFEARWWPLLQRLRPYAPSLRINHYKAMCKEAVGWTEFAGTLSGAALLVPRWVAQKIGPRDPRFNHFGEEHLWQGKMARLGLKRIFVPQARIFHWEAASVATDPLLAKIDQRTSRTLFLAEHENISRSTAPVPPRIF